MNLVTHNGTFHADDVTAYAVLHALFPNAPLVRTRDPELIRSGGIVFDVGMEHAPERFRFDHHMKDGPKRADGQPYSSVGLIWKQFGMQYLRQISNVSDAFVDRVWNEVDSTFIREIDLVDNGVGKPDGSGYAALVDDFNPRWDGSDDEDGAFLSASFLAREILDRRVRKALANALAMKLATDAAEAAEDPRVVELPYHMPWEDAIFEGGFDEALYVVYERGGTWYCTAVPPERGSFDRRKSLPNEWGGLRGGELETVSGVKGAVFCHPALFICGADSREGIMEMAKKAVAYDEHPTLRA